jgi:hypothetical protein
MSALAMRRDTHTAVSEVWRCTGCRRVLGVVTGDRVRITHRGRQIDSGLPCYQTCDECRTLNVQRATLDDAHPS